MVKPSVTRELSVEVVRVKKTAKVKQQTGRVETRNLEMEKAEAGGIEAERAEMGNLKLRK